RGVTGVLIDAITLRRGLAVDAYHDALAAETLGQPVDERRVGERRRVHRDLFGAFVEHRLRVLHRADAAGDAEWNVQAARDPAHPAAIHAALLGAGRDVIEHQFVGALVAVARRQIQNVADHAVITEAHALDDLSVAHVEAGNYAFGKNGRSSCSAMRSSSNALPLMAAGVPIAASAARSAPVAMPPEACQRICGNRASASRYSARFGPTRAPSRAISVHSTCCSPASHSGGSASQSDSALSCCQPRVRMRGTPASS